MWKRRNVGRKKEGVEYLMLGSTVIIGLDTINLFISAFFNKKFALSSSNSGLLVLSLIKFLVMRFPNVKLVIPFLLIETKIAFQTQSCQHKITTDKVTSRKRMYLSPSCHQLALRQEKARWPKITTMWEPPSWRGAPVWGPLGSLSEAIPLPQHLTRIWSGGDLPVKGQQQHRMQLRCSLQDPPLNCDRASPLLWMEADICSGSPDTSPRAHGAHRLKQKQQVLPRAPTFGRTEGKL